MNRYAILSVALLALAQFAGCGQATSTQNSNAANSNTASTATSNNPPASNNTTAGDGAPVASAHRSANNAAPVSGGSSPAASSDKPDIETKELDAEITRAEEKAKPATATDADKRAAATAYVKRANVYYAAGRPTLYKFALGDFRRALRYQPDNAEAREKIDTIVSIYESLGRPVPTNGSEQ